MNSEHWLLVFLWIAYCLIHSILADSSVKRKIEQLLGQWFRYYRLMYSFFAFITLGLLLWFQFAIISPLLFASLFLRLPGLIFCLPGIYIMIICINKYFYELSGIQSLKKDQPIIHLQQMGLHKYIRHPLYFGTLIFIWGLFIIMPALSHLIACVIITIYVVIGIKLEEKKLYIEFGEAYKEYSRQVPMLIPKLNKTKGSV